jgi:hypothetical protein
MKYKNINVLKAAWILITIFYSSLLWAQPFSGGDNSGAFASNTVAINCTSNRYFGGDNEGAASAASNLLNCTTARFFGDTADGAGFAKTNTFDCTPIRFSGDTADGSSIAKTNNFDCTPLRFFGDTADGSTLVKTNNFNCTPSRFFGDTADGFASAKFLLIRDFLGNDTSVTIICSNETFNLLTLYTTPANLTYNWSAATPTATGLGIYTLIATNQSGCVDTAQATLKQEIAIWNGSVSNNWHTAANWNNGEIPSEITHVIIPGSAANPCQIKDTDATAASVQAKASGSFSIINNRILLISGTCVQLPTGQ